MPDRMVSFTSFEDEVSAIFPDGSIEEDHRGRVIIYTGCEFQYEHDGAYIAGNIKFDNDEYVFGFAIGYFYGRTVGDLDMAREELTRRFSDTPHPAYIAGMNAGYGKGFAMTNPLADYLQQMVGLIKSAGTPSVELKYSSHYEYVLVNGKPYTGNPIPRSYSEKKLGQCYMNSARLAIDYDDLTYVEGYGLKRGLIPLNHAWCVDREGRVIDVTWRDSEDCWYYGVEFSTKDVVKNLIDTGYYGIFENDFLVGHRILKEGGIGGDGGRSDPGEDRTDRGPD